MKTTKPEIFNSDQGSQFTSNDFTGILEKEGIRISMNGKGRAYDNIFVEHLCERRPESAWIMAL
jgi:putative transposase